MSNHNFMNFHIKHLRIAIFLLAVCLPLSVGHFVHSQEKTVIPSPEIKFIPLTPADGTNPDKKVRLRIVSFNDFHGNYREKTDSLGAAKFITAIERFANDHPKDYPTSVYTFCAGDTFFGTALSHYSTLDRTSGKEKPDSPSGRFLALAHVTAACIGNHEFDWGASFLEDHLKKSVVVLDGKPHPIYSASNILNKTTRQPPGGVSAFDIISPAGTDYKIAIITLTTLEAVTKSLPAATDCYVFERPSAAAKRLMETIKDVDAFIFLTHMASVQFTGGWISFLRDEEEMRELIKLKPLAIITAHSHQFVSGQVDGVPIIQAGCHGNGLASINFIIDPERRSILEESRNFVNLFPDRESIPPDPKMERVIVEAVESCHFSTLGTVRDTLRKDRNTMNDLGSLVTKALTTSFPETTKEEPVLAFQHGGGIRADLPKGPITEEDCFNILPFVGRMCLCRLPGNDVLKLLREGLTNKNGCLQCSSMTFYYDSVAAKRSDFKHVAFTEKGNRYWIEPEKEYWVALDRFIVSGGDGYDRSIFENRIVIADGPLPRDVLARYFKDDLKGDIVFSESDHPAFVVMPSASADFRGAPPASESLQKLPRTSTP